MNSVLFSILLVLIGLILGFGVSFLINMLRDNLLSKKTERMLAQTKKEIDKMKRDAALEQKEEAHKIKMDLEKEIREKKEE